MSRTRVAAVCFAVSLLAGVFRVWPVAAQSHDLRLRTRVSVE